MAEAYLGEIRIFAGSYAPYGWAFCNGQLLPISQNTALYSILGVQYGGDGKTTFALPDLTGRAPIHAGTGPGLTPRTLGQKVGDEAITLLMNQIPAHTHQPQAQSSDGNAATPENNVWATTNTGGRGGKKNFFATTNTTTLAPTILNAIGGSQPHNNMQPYLAINFIICLSGEYPQRD